MKKNELYDAAKTVAGEQNFPLSALLAWFNQIKRDLPWRKKPSFYEVLISEFMLQQTQVQTVVPYYNRWMDRFPTLLHLAQASSDEVIKAWEGLGYYSRARNLHQIAKHLQTVPMPQTYGQLKALKGIGDYTAKALLAFAYNQSEIALDGNVLRVAARFYGVFEPIKSQKAKTAIQALLDGVKKEGGQMAEALIELGALICKKKPECAQCPLQKGCYAFYHQKIAQLPQVEKRRAIKKFSSLIAICECNGEVLVIKRAKKLMRDLYEFPKESELPYHAAFEKVFLPSCLRHFTTFSETLIPYRIKLFVKWEGAEYLWVSYEKLDALPFSSGHRTIKERVLKNEIFIAK